jgi:hypothetical protein
LPFDAEDLARAVLIRVIPRRRYRTAAPTDARFAAFAGDTVRVAVRQQGADPCLMLFCGPGQDVRRAALAAADWAAASWRPNAIQRRMRPGVVAIQVAPASELVPAGPLADAPVATAIWTVDSDSGRCDTPGRPPGAPPPGEVRAAAEAAARGVPPPSLGQLDYAEREIMHGRGAPMPPVLTGVGALLVAFFALRFALQVFGSVVLWARLAQAGGVRGLIGAGFVVSNLLLLAGIVLGAGLLLNAGNLAYRAPGFSSASRNVRRASWIGYVLVMLALLAVVEYVLPQALRATVPTVRR